jgi:hypothetical protein
VAQQRVRQYPAIVEDVGTLRFATRVGRRRQFGQVVTVDDDGVEVNVIAFRHLATDTLVDDGYGRSAGHEW